MMRLLSAVLLTIVCTSTAYLQTSLKIGSPAPAFAGTTLTGTSRELKDLRGKVVVVTFWSTKCVICHAEIPKLNQFAGRFGPSNVLFLALTMENDEKVAAYLKSNPFNFEIIPNSFGTVLDYADRDKSGSLDMGFPAYFVIDQHGDVRFRSGGYNKTGPLSDAIGKLLKN